MLEALIARAPLGLSDLASDLKIPKSSLYRVCAVLLERGWLLRNSDGRYALGIRAFGLTAQSSEYPIVRAFRGIAADLLTRHNETVCLAVLDSDESTFIAIETGSNSSALRISAMPSSNRRRNIKYHPYHQCVTAELGFRARARLNESPAPAQSRS